MSACVLDRCRVVFLCNAGHPATALLALAWASLFVDMLGWYESERAWDAMAIVFV
jgi:hypothetical protein